jgi:desulfoferrodoxin (superoxide reductase-like protein)
MYAKDNQKHHIPHIHVEYQDDEAVFSIHEGKLLEGKLPNKKIQLVKAWIIINQEDLIANWNLAMKGNTLFKIKPLT